jgi:phosphatidylserine decarboxylase
VARDGWLFVGPALVLAGVASVAGLLGWTLGWVLCVLAVLMACGFAYFFRDPNRRIPDDAGAIVAPADGRILVVTALANGCTRIDTFLSVLDVHVNRSPIGGRVVSSNHRPGKYFAAMRPEAAECNERQEVSLETPLGTVRFSQIAGVLARRIVCRLRLGDVVKTGDRIGMIRFGSRMEVIVPPGVIPAVTVGERVRAGESIIAHRAVSDRPA